MRTLETLHRRLSESVGALPGIVDGLRIDDVGEPIEPEQVRASAAGELNDAAIALDQAQAATNRAWQLMSRLYVEAVS